MGRPPREANRIPILACASKIDRRGCRRRPRASSGGIGGSRSRRTSACSNRRPWSGSPSSNDRASHRCVPRRFGTLGARGLPVSRNPRPTACPAGLKGFRAARDRSGGGRLRRRTQGNQVEVAGMEGRGAQQAAFRVDLEETIEAARKDEVLDLERPLLVPEWMRDIRREGGLDPFALHSQNPSEHPPRIDVQEGAELSEWDGLDRPEFAQARRGSVPIVVETERTLQDSRGETKEVHDHKGHPPSAIDERKHVASRSFGVTEDDKPANTAVRMMRTVSHLKRLVSTIKP